MRNQFIIQLLLASFLGILITSCTSATGSGGISAVTPIPETVEVEPAAASSLPTPIPATVTPERLTPPTITPNPTALAAVADLPDLPQGASALAARATDAAMSPEEETSISFDENETVTITFEEFYDGYDLRKGLQISEKLLAMDGQPVVMQGYMAPPLKPEIDFFVLTQTRLEFCPFCSTDADWPNDIAVIYVLGDPATTTLNPVQVTGRMEIGRLIDEETGMFSYVRIYAEDIEILN